MSSYKVLLERIVAHPIITLSRNTRPFVDVNELLSDPPLLPARVHASASVATIVRMALDGVGIVILPASIVAEELKQKALTEIDCAAQVPDLKFVAGWLAVPRYCDHPDDHRHRRCRDAVAAWQAASS